MDDDVIHPLAEFGSIPWDKLDPEKVGCDWSIGQGGYGFKSEAWHLTTFETTTKGCGFISHIWELPPALGSAFDLVKAATRNTARREFRNKLHAALMLGDDTSPAPASPDAGRE